MKHLLNNQSFHTIFDERKLIISDSPSQYKGLILSYQIRIFFFEEKPKIFLIDFIEQELQFGCAFIVPPMHIHYLSPSETCRFFCLDIHDSVIDNREATMLFACKYSKQKVINFLKNGEKIFTTLQQLDLKPFSEIYYLDFLKNWIYEQTDFIRPYQNLNNKTIKLINQFLESLNTKELKLDSCVVKKVADEIKCSDRTLHRACVLAFGIGTKEVLKYHIILKGIYLLSRQDGPISAVAKSLGFSSVSAFDKCIKRITNYSPKIFQETLKFYGI